MTFTGSLVAIITPFQHGKVDEKALGDLIEWQIASGTDGIVPCGTTGESATLTYDEHNRVIEVTVEVAKRRVPVIAGTGSNSTDEAIALTRHAKQVGVDAVLIISPYYNKPTQEGLFQHHKAIAETVDIPQILYNIPGRTAVNTTPQTVARLAKLKNVVGIKEGAGSLQQVSEIVQLCGDGFTILSGDDALTLPMMAVGAKGVISVTANVAPAEMAAMVDAWAAGDATKARVLHYKLYPLFQNLFLETNPIPVKHAVALLGKATAELRLPLCPMSQGNLDTLRQALKDFGLL
jgi:4-hydroxy-tetrahydrodipicolinate synthase